MKRLTVLALAAALLLTGCGRITELSDSVTEPATSVTPAQPVIPEGLAVTALSFHEVGGEDGRNTEWTVFQEDGNYIARMRDESKGEILTYHIIAQDFEAITSIDFSDYIGQTASKEEGLCDGIDYDTRIVYEDGTVCTSGVYIQALWNLLSAIPDRYQPVDTEYPYDDVDNLLADTDVKYSYLINNHADGQTERGYYLTEGSEPDASLVVCICMGERSTGGYSINVDSIEAHGDTVVIIVEETSPAPDEMVTEAFTYPACSVEISPKPAAVIVQNTGGVAFEQLEPSASDGIGALYYEEVSPEDILYDEAHNVYYAKNQLLISAEPGTDVAEIRAIAEEIDAEIIGMIELTGDYQIRFRHDATMEEMEQAADQLNSYSFVLNVTLNMVEDVTTED